MSWTCRIVSFITLLGLAATSLVAQETATLAGRVTDPGELAVARAKVVATNVETGVSSGTESNEVGLYRITGLQPGSYRISVLKDGFAEVVRSGVTLHVQDVITLNFALRLGSVRENITVSGDASIVNTESAAVSTVVDRQFVQNMPLNGRSFQSLIALTPGVVTSPTGSLINGRFAVNGQRSDANSFTVDGVSANVYSFPGLVAGAQTGGNLPALTALGTTQSLASLDAMQEFRVQTSTYAAEYGRQPGAQISVSTRSGTNTLHGLLFEYLRNDAFDATDWFARRSGQPKPPEKQNDFGGTLGGPIVIPGLYDGHNRTFFFASYEGLRLRLPQFVMTNVPTATLRQTAAAGLQPFLNAYPMPNGRDLGNGLAEFTASYSNPSNLDAMSLRIDHALNRKWNIFARYNRVPSENLSRAVSLLNASTQTMQTVTIGATGNLAPRITNEVRFNLSANYGRTTLTSRDFFGATPVTLDTAVPQQYVSGTSAFSISLGFVGLTCGCTPSITLINGFYQDLKQLNFVDNLAFGVGSHRFKVGVDYRRPRSFNAANLYRVDMRYTTQQQLINNLSGTATASTRSPFYPSYNNVSAYVQDSWKVSRRLTLDLGLRWDVNPAPGEAHDNDPLAVTQVTNLASMQLATRGTQLWKTTFANLAPRLGIAYQFREKEGYDTVLRGGFGVFYDTGNEAGSRGFNSYPFQVNRTTAGFSLPLSQLQATPPPLPSLASLTPPYGTISVSDPDLKLPYTLQWNVAVQQSFGNDQALTLTYVGAAGRRLLQQRQLNLATVNPLFTFVNLTTNNATSDYNGLQMQFQRRLSRGLQVLASYTWSHALDEDSSDMGTIIPVRGNASFDLRHSFVTALTYDIPTPHPGALQAVFGHWSIDTNLRAQTGFPVDITGTLFVNPADGTLVAARANVVPGVPIYVDDPAAPGGRRINRAAFTIPAPGQFGNLGRNAVRGLGLWQQDFAVRRQFKLTNTLGLQFRAEAFNVFNHPNFGAIQTSLTAANFGQAINMANRQLSGTGELNQLYQFGGPRSLQLALRLSF